MWRDFHVVLLLSHIYCCSADDTTHKLLKIQHYSEPSFPTQSKHFSFLTPVLRSTFSPQEQQRNKIYLQCILCLVCGSQSLVLYINVTTDQLQSIFVSLKYLETFFPFPKTCMYCMNTKKKGFCHLKKGTVYQRCEKMSTRCTLCHQDSEQQLLSCHFLTPGNRLGSQGCSCRCFASQFVACPCLWVRNALPCRSPCIMNNWAR